ncbi:tetratricopeptide repeat protein [Rhodoflexus sp.]
MKKNSQRLFLSLIVLLFGSIANFTQAQKRIEKDFINAENAFNNANYTQSITLLGKVISRHADHLAAYKLRAQAFAAINDYNSAIADYTKAIEITPNDPNLYIGRSEAYRALGNMKAALEDLDAAILLENNSIKEIKNDKEKLLNQRAVMHMQAGNYASALADYVTLSEIDPANGQYMKARREAFDKVGQEELVGMIELGQINLAASGMGGLPGPVADDQNTIEVRKYISEHKFASLNEGRNYYYQLLARKDFATGKKTVLLSQLREKILIDIFGEHPYMEDIEAMKRLVETENWINPEGKKRYFQLINDSRYWFTGGVQRGDTYYFYKVMRSRNSSKYKMQMFAVVNNASNLVLNSEVVVQEDSTGTRTIEIPAAENKGYMWQTSKTDKLRSIGSAESNSLQFETAGNLSRFSSSAKTLIPQQQFESFIKPKGTDLNDAIKATLNYLILEYPKMFVLR